MFSYQQLKGEALQDLVMRMLISLPAAGGWVEEKAGATAYRPGGDGEETAERLYCKDEILD